MNFIEVYTDGACTQGAFMPWPGGWAILILINGQKVLTASDGKFHTTNNEMELTAFLEGLKLVEKELKPSSDDLIVVHTDSAYIHNCFEQKWYEKWFANNWINSSKESVKNKELWIEIFNIVSRLHPAIKKVKAHSNNEHNNYVDMLAVEAKQKVVEEHENNSNLG
jgi:ribonuclease HI